MSFKAGTGLMGVTEPGQRVTAENAHKLPAGSVVRLNDGGRLIHLHDGLWLWLSESGCSWRYSSLSGQLHELPGTLCHIPPIKPESKLVAVCKEVVAYSECHCTNGDGSCAYCMAVEALAEIGACPDGLLPDGDKCPRCGQQRAPSGIDGGTWVHLN